MPSSGCASGCSSAVAPATSEVRNLFGLADLEPARSVAQILLVDDDLHVRRSIERMLTRGGHAVVACARAATASELVSAGTPFDVLMIDHGVAPVTWVDELLQAARRVNPGVTVIVITGGLVDGTCAFEVMQKPVRSGALLGAIHRVMDLRA
jgi:DNA-binding NtrC family response regulator